MLPLFTACLVLLVPSVVALPHDTFISTLTSRQAANSLSDCNATCTEFATLDATCKSTHTKHCGCNDQYLQAQGDCLVCKTTNPQDAATVQFLLDAEVDQCQQDGIPIQFELNLPPAAQAIVDDFNHQSAVLRREQRAFLALQIAGGHVGLVIVLAFAIFSRRVRRDPTFLNFCITWIFSSVVNSLLLYRGTKGNTVANTLAHVVPNTCLAQASLINGAQVMTACATLALVVQLWIGLRAAIHGSGMKQKKLVTSFLLAMPYVLFFSFAITSVFVGRKFVVIEGTSLQRVLPANFYCAIIQLRPFLRAIYGATLGLLIITAVFDILIITILYRHWLAFRNIQTSSAVSLSILLRVMAFSIYRVTVSVAFGTVLDSPPKTVQAGSGDSLTLTFSVPVWVDMLQAAIPLVGFLVLGINMDMINSLMFWRKYKGEISTVQTMNSVNSVGTNAFDLDEKAGLDADAKYVSSKV